MKYLVRFLVIVFVFGGAISNAQNPIVEKTEEALVVFEPLDVGFNDGVLQVVADERRVTDLMYEIMLSTICANASDDEGALAGVQEMHFLNEFKRQGYIFDGGIEECAELNSMAVGSDEKKRFIVFRTYFHTNN